MKDQPRNVSRSVWGSLVMPWLSSLLVPALTAVCHTLVASSFGPQCGSTLGAQSAAQTAGKQ